MANEEMDRIAEEYGDGHVIIRTDGKGRIDVYREGRWVDLDDIGKGRFRSFKFFMFGVLIWLVMTGIIALAGGFG